MDVWFNPFIWLDYRLAVVFTVIIPLILLIWSAFKQVESIQRLLIIYWRVASLLMITIYLMIPLFPEGEKTGFFYQILAYGFVTGFLARVLIPLSLWFWVDLNDEIKDLAPSWLKLSLTAWRWAITLYCSVGAIATLPFLSCAFSGTELNTPYCQAWLQAPWHYKEGFHPNLSAGFLGFLGIMGLIIYLLYFASFLLFRLGKTGRIALEQ
jgi:hypothetical protein